MSLKKNYDTKIRKIILVRYIVRFVISRVDCVMCISPLSKSRQVTCVVRERQLRLCGLVARLPAEDPTHRILFWRDPSGWTMSRGRPQASWLRQVESYLKDAGMTGLASVWAMAIRRPKEYFARWTRRSAALAFRGGYHLTRIYFDPFGQNIHDLLRITRIIA